MERVKFQFVDTSEQLERQKVAEGENYTKKPIKERQSWDSKWQYIFMVISYAVGLGNIWRFPYLVQQHGGGAFLIPYLIMLFIEGMPILYLEFAIGQKMQKGTVIVWNEINPLLGGIGLASAVTSFNVAIYYNGIIVWCFYYLFHSFQSPLPWAKCPTEFSVSENATVENAECVKGGATSYFWYRQALDISPGMDSPGGIKWKMLLFLLLAWIIVYICIFKGIKSSGKVVYFTAIFPYIVLLIFLFRGITLRGAGVGLLHMFTPKLDRLADAQVWLDAATQIFFSFGLGFGGLIAFSSYNSIHNNCQRDAILISFCNWFTAIFASIAIFSVLGFKATLMYDNCQQHNFHVFGVTYPELAVNMTQETFQSTYAIAHNFTKPNDTWKCNLEDDLNNAASGTGLAFIIFTQAIVEFGPSAPFWSILFFLMILSLGMGSEFGTIEGFTASIYDLEPFPFITRRKWLLSALICTFSCLVGLLFVLGSGSYWLTLFDHFAGSYPLIVVAMCECYAVAYVYGVNKFADDIEFMIGSRPYKYWVLIWKFVAPFVVTGILIAVIVKYFLSSTTYSAYHAATATQIQLGYPWYAVLVALILVFSSVGLIPLIALLRKLRISNWNYAKQIQAETLEATSSTARFIKSESNLEMEEYLQA